MDDNEFTRVATGITAPGEDKRVVTTMFIERRMGRPVTGEKIKVVFGPQMMIGRDKSCEITIDDSQVSRKHALIRIDPEAARFSDLGSTNGSARNGETIKEEIILESGDKISLGKGPTFDVRVVERDGNITTVRLVSGHGAFLLAPHEFIIGFADPHSHDVDFKIYDPSILPKHARVECFMGKTFIISLDDQRQVKVNAKPAKEVEIHDNYVIEIGDTLLRFERTE